MKRLVLYKTLNDVNKIKQDLKQFGFDYYFLMFLIFFSFKTRTERLKRVYSILFTDSIKTNTVLYVPFEDALKPITIYNYKKDLESPKDFLSECINYRFNCSIETVLYTVNQAFLRYPDSIIIFKEIKNA